MLNIVFWMDCRSIGLIYYLKNKIDFNLFRYEIHIIGGFNEKKYLTEEKHNIPSDILKNADIFVYVFVDKKYLKYSTDPAIKTENVLSFLSDKCIKIGLHGAHMECFWPLIPHKHATNSEFFNNIKGMTSDEIITAFHNKELNFNLKKRFEDNIQYTLNREEYWKNGFKDDNNHFIISCVDFIKDNYKDHRLFITHCHPTSYIFIYQINQIINIINKYYDLNIELYNDIFSNSIRFPGIPDGDWKDSSYIINELDVKWIEDPDDEFYLDFILNNYKNDE